jgi:hypothetical protein
MARGLSDLQKAILRHAAAKGALCQAVFLCEHFGWKPTKGRAVSEIGQNFCLASIGESKYRKNANSLSRALRRLVQRGLLEEDRQHVTEKGRELIRSWGLVPPPPRKSLAELTQQIRRIVGPGARLPASSPESH